ncbi:MAG: DUF2769 domain-containing protein [archaeon]|nr:DUF2769 domain-containing protein [archaeon]
MEVPDTEENLKKCICMNCPSYNECMKTGMQGLFCARGKTDCDLERLGCICNQCPISSDYQLFGGYYCAIGTDWDEDFGKAIKALIGTTFVPLKVAADIAGDIAENLGAYIPKPSKLASTIINTRISALKTITKAIEKEITLLEEYKKKLEAEEAKKKEKVKVE